VAGRTLVPPWPIIDVHVHTSCADPAVAGRIAEAAREFGVCRVVNLGDVIGFGYHPTPEQIQRINDETAASVVAFPDLFIGFCHVNPEHPSDFSVAEIERCVRERGFRGVKLEATVVARDARLDPVMEAARRLGVPVLHHAWYQAVRETEGESTPADIADLASRFPDVPVIMAHLGGARIRGVLDVRPRENVVVDTSGSQPMGELVEYAVATIGADRIVYGSDAPGRDFSAQLGRVLGARIGDADRRKILAGNAARILGL
jgi:predicted TIM-barrel fold metal-dependent hydrolase